MKHISIFLKIIAMFFMAFPLILGFFYRLIEFSFIVGKEHADKFMEEEIIK